MNKVGLIRIEPKVDDRGYISQIYNSDFPNKLARFYLVGNFAKGTVRGMHYHQREWKYFFVTKGSAKFVISPTDKPSKKTQTFVLSDKNSSLLVVPPGYYNGWVSLENETQLLGMSSFTLKETLANDKRIDPRTFSEYFQVISR